MILSESIGTFTQTICINGNKVNIQIILNGTPQYFEDINTLIDTREKVSFIDKFGKQHEFFKHRNWTCTSCL
jgi:hypothetical protein